VPNWQCSLSGVFEPRLIIETVQYDAPIPALRHPQSLEKFSNWACYKRKETLVVHGRILGSVTDVISSASLLGRDERAFEQLRQAWKAEGLHGNVRWMRIFSPCGRMSSMRAQIRDTIWILYRVQVPGAAVRIPPRLSFENVPRTTQKRYSPRHQDERIHSWCGFKISRCIDNSVCVL
jgi:hypothetical protein